MGVSLVGATPRQLRNKDRGGLYFHCPGHLAHLSPQQAGISHVHTLLGALGKHKSCLGATAAAVCIQVIKKSCDKKQPTCHAGRHASRYALQEACVPQNACVAQEACIGQEACLSCLQAQDFWYMLLYMQQQMTSDVRVVSQDKSVTCTCQGSLAEKRLMLWTGAGKVLRSLLQPKRSCCRAWAKASNHLSNASWPPAGTASQAWLMSCEETVIREPPSWTVNICTTTIFSCSGLQSHAGMTAGSAASSHGSMRL